MNQANQKDLMADNDAIKSEMQKIYNELIDLIQPKMDKKEVDLVRKKMYDEIEKKVI